MADFHHFVYKYVEGTSTEWDDIQRSLGNLPPKPEPFKPPSFVPKVDVAEQPKSKEWLDEREPEELEELQDDLDDDRFLEQYRTIARSLIPGRRRLKQVGAMPMDDDVGVIAAVEEDSLATPLLQPTAVARDPFVKVRLYRRGAGPVALFRSRLVGPRRDRLDVRSIQAEHGLRALFAFKPGQDCRRGLRIRSDPAAGYSALPFRDGAVIVLDGEPKESWTKPVSLIVAGLLVPAVMAMVAVKGVPEPLRSSRVVNGLFPPWILLSAVIIFARVRMRPRAP